MERIQRVIGKTRPHVRGFLVFLSVLILIVTTYSVTNMKDVYVTGEIKSVERHTIFHNSQGERHIQQSGNKNYSTKRPQKQATGKYNTQKHRHIKPTKKKSEKYSHSKFCGTGWQKKYARLHSNILASKKEERYLAYTCPGTQQGCCGYGNRLRALVSIFYLAVLTDRAFLIDWLVPEPIENHLKPNKIQWNYSTPLDICEGPDFRNHYWGTASADKKKAEGWIIQDSKHFRNWFLSTNLSRYFDQPVEKITTIWYFVDGGINKNPYLMTRAKQLGITPLLSPGPKYALIRCAFDFLFQRSILVESYLKQWRNELHKSKGPTIGIHIRTGDKQFNYFAQKDDRSLNLQSTSNLRQFFRCAKHIEQTVFKNANANDSRWFLASDHIKVKQFAKKYFRRKVISTNLTIQHLDILHNTTEFNETLECNFTTGVNGSAICYNIVPFNKTEYCANRTNITNGNYTADANITQKITEGIIGMLVDHFILSECDFLIVCDSSFSSTAIGLGMRDTNSFVFGNRHCLDYKRAKKIKNTRFFRRKRSLTNSDYAPG